VDTQCLYAESVQALSHRLGQVEKSHCDMSYMRVCYQMKSSHHDGHLVTVYLSVPLRAKYEWWGDTKVASHSGFVSLLSKFAVATTGKDMTRVTVLTSNT
jgi:hypothetical protein